MRPYLTANFFETGGMAIPTNSQNSTALVQGVPGSTQWSHPSTASSRLCHWRHSFSDNCYPPQNFWNREVRLPILAEWRKK